MGGLIERSLIKIWNRRADRPSLTSHSVHLGFTVEAGRRSSLSRILSGSERAEHVAILGKTGSGKSSLLKHLCAQDVAARRGFLFVDLHGDATPELLSIIAAEEDRTRSDLSSRTVVIDPADRDCSIGVNILERGDSQENFVVATGIVQLLKERWSLEVLGARTEEVLRNSLVALIENGLTFVDIVPLLTRPSFRARCIAGTSNPEVVSYFRDRFDRASAAMQAVIREAVLNKATTFTGDPHFRHLLGQQQPRFDLRRSLDEGHWIILNLEKGRLGDEATTLGALLLSHFKWVLFQRQKRELFTLYGDELQNLVSIEHGFEALLAESRKFGVSIISANQYLDQYPWAMRSAVLAVGTQVFFRLSGPDALWVSAMLGGGSSLSELLQTLPTQQFILKPRVGTFDHLEAPTVFQVAAESTSLVRRSQERWCRPRKMIEEQIAQRQSASVGKDDLHGWE